MKPGDIKRIEEAANQYAERKGWNEAIDAVLLRLAYLGVFQDKSHPRYTEIQKAKRNERM